MHLGVDWASGAWVSVIYPDRGDPRVEVSSSIADLWDDVGKRSERMVVDVPIGLCGSLAAESDPCLEQDGKLSRQCDRLARRAIRPRASSVFPTPARNAVQLAADGADYAIANKKNRALTGKGVMQQAVSMAPGIIAVDRLLEAGADPEVLVEGHPELSFRAFMDSALQYSKKTAAGVAERLAALEEVPEYSPRDWRELANQLRDEDHQVTLDDLLDALGLALTAGAREQEFQQLPPKPPEDLQGRPMRMVYRRSEPFPESVYS